MGRPKLPKGQAKTFIKMIRMTPERVTHLDKCAAYEGMTRSQFIRKSLRDHLTGNFKYPKGHKTVSGQIVQ